MAVGGARRAAALALLGALMTAGCAAPSRAADSTVTVYRSRGAIQCGDRGLAPADMARSLVDAGVQVLRSACGHDGLMRAATCGTPTGDINIFEIPAAGLDAARRLGFRELAALPQAREVVCRR